LFSFFQADFLQPGVVLKDMPRVTRKIIIEALILALSQPPAQAGMRLRAERELATVFKVSRPTLRVALAALEEQGILIQQQGSGTYLRRVPMANGGYSATPSFPVPSADQLFATEEMTESSAAVERRSRLKLQLWTHLHRYTPSLRLQLESFAEAAAAGGHDLEVIGASTDENVYLPREKIAAMLKGSPCDGYLLDTLVADHALADFEATGKPFIVFSGTPPVQHEPAVLTDLAESIERAVPLLAREGYRRIALMSYAAADLDMQRFVYERAMRRAGLSYYCHLMADVASPEESRRILLLQLRGLEPPDAIYVSDDNLLPGVAKTLEDAGLTPGVNFGVITMAVNGLPLPAGFVWSQMQFRPRWYARCVLDNLLGFMQSSDQEPHCEAHYHHWVPGDTHRRAARVNLK
jgi:DNA-binding transcriptional regulator YhcF (GntR family)